MVQEGTLVYFAFMREGIPVGFFFLTLVQSEHDRGHLGNLSKTPETKSLSFNKFSFSHLGFTEDSLCSSLLKNENRLRFYS